MKHQGWNVYLRGKWIDCVFCDADMDAWHVKDGLVNHDGMNPAIRIRRA